MNDPMERVLSSLERARRHLDHPEPRLDVHSVVHELMRDLLGEMGVLRKTAASGTPQANETAGQEWLYELIEGLTDTCFSLAESPPDEAARVLRARIDKAVGLYRR